MQRRTRSPRTAAWPWGSVLALVSVPVPSGPAVAGAWTLAAGDGQAIASAIFSRGERYFDERGRLIPEPSYRKFELPIWVEYGLTDRLTVIASPSLRQVELGSPEESRAFGAGYTELGSRLLLWENGAQVVSVQATARIPGTRRAESPADVGWTGSEADLRILWGTSFEVGPWPAFADVQAAYRSRGGGPADEVRLDLTVGVRPFPRWTLLLQSFNTVSVGPAAEGFGELRSHQVSLSVAYTIGSVTFQAGGLATVAGRNFLEERGLVGGVWYRF